jgi:hypothetical protein
MMQELKAKQALIERRQAKIGEHRLAFENEHREMREANRRQWRD